MDDLLKKKLQAKGAVLIEGPKWCGKTTTAEEIAASKVLLARADVKSNFKSLLEIDAVASLVFILGVLGISIGASLFAKKS